MREHVTFDLPRVTMGTAISPAICSAAATDTAALVRLKDMSFSDTSQCNLHCILSSGLHEPAVTSALRQLFGAVCIHTPRYSDSRFRARAPLAGTSGQVRAVGGFKYAQG